VDKEQTRKLLQPILWDYQIDPYDFVEVAIGNKDRIGSFSQEKALVRIFERLSWYDLINLFGIEQLTKLLTKQAISGIRIRELREKYEFARKILHGEAVSFSGGSPEYREKIRNSLLSDRWYRVKQS
jgi:hypothetical protein